MPPRGLRKIEDDGKSYRGLERIKLAKYFGRWKRNGRLGATSVEWIFCKLIDVCDILHRSNIISVGHQKNDIDEE